MNYAMIENGIVTNVLWLYPGNAHEFPGVVPIDNIPTGIGDTYDGEHFYRNGERIKSNDEVAWEASEALAILLGE